jgi:putative serine protease XkdF
MKIYELIFNEETHFIDRVSIVNKGAVEAHKVYFSEEAPEKMYFADDEKRIVYSVAMRPNKMIFRSNVSSVVGVAEPAQVYYTPETVERLQQYYFKNQNNARTNVNHQSENVSGVYPFESWIVNDVESDKSKTLGLEVLKGDWVMGFKIDNDEVWQEVKNGNLGELSIEAHLGFKEQKQEIKMNKNSILKDIKDFNIKMAADLTQFGDVYAMSLAEGEIVSDADGNPMVNASFEFEGKNYKTDDMGAIVSIEDVAIETSEENASETAAEEVTAEDTTEQAPAVDLEAENAKLKEENANLQEQVSKLEAEKIAAEQKMVTMAAETPAAKPIVNAPIEVKMKWEDMTPLERRRLSKQN